MEGKAQPSVTAGGLFVGEACTVFAFGIED